MAVREGVHVWRGPDVRRTRALRNWWACLAAFCVGPLGVGFCDEEPIRVLTYNVRYANRGDGEDRWENRRETVLATVAGSDLVGLQEVLASQQDDIERATEGWQWAAVGRDDGLRRGEMVPVGWRAQALSAVEQGAFWLSEHPERVGRAGWDAALPRIATWVRLVRREASGVTGSPPTLLVVNTHFDHRGEEARRQSALLLRRWVAEHRGESDVLVIGDFNAMIGSPPLHALLSDDSSEHPLFADARDHAGKPDPGPDSTWNGFSRIKPGARIDHILFQGSRLRVLAYETLDPRTPSGRFASDHLPVTAAIAFP